MFYFQQKSRPSDFHDPARGPRPTVFKRMAEAGIKSGKGSHGYKFTLNVQDKEISNKVTATFDTWEHLKAFHDENRKQIVSSQISNIISSADARRCVHQYFRYQCIHDRCFVDFWILSEEVGLIFSDFTERALCRLSPNTVERVALPAIVAGLNIDIITADLKGTSIAAAHAALITFDALKEGSKIAIVASTEEFLADVETEIHEIGKLHANTPSIARLGSASIGDAGVILALPCDKSKLAPLELQLVIVCELNAIIRFVKNSLNSCCGVKGCF